VEHQNLGSGKTTKDLRRVTLQELRNNYKYRERGTQFTISAVAYLMVTSQIQRKLRPSRYQPYEEIQGGTALQSREGWCAIGCSQGVGSLLNGRGMTL
jgi:hypothetical protein